MEDLCNIAIHGAAGRVGRRLIDLAGRDAKWRIVAALEHANHPQLGQDSGLVAGCEANGVPLSSSLDVEADAIIDFSLPQAVASILQLAQAKNIPLVVATTGLDATAQDRIAQTAASIPVVWAPNMSLAVNLTMRLAQTAAAVLAQSNPDVDVEISETHHRFKADAPSGTALKFGQIIAEQMGQTDFAHGREGDTGQRPRNQIGYHALRAGDDPGQHTILFGMLGEKVEIRVAASNRDCYAHGALLAARFVANAKAGLYDMQDVLGLN